MTCPNFILNCMSLFLVVFLVNIPLMKYRSVSPALMENHSNTQALLLFISQQHHRFQLSASRSFSKLTARSKNIVRGHAHFMNVLAGRGRSKGILAKIKRIPRNKNQKKRTFVKNLSSSSLLNRSRHEVSWNLGLPSSSFKVRQTGPEQDNQEHTECRSPEGKRKSSAFTPAWKQSFLQTQGHSCKMQCHLKAFMQKVQRKSFSKPLCCAEQRAAIAVRD